MTGATVERGNAYASPLSTEIAEHISEKLGRAGLGVTLMSTGSMRAFPGAMAADYDLTAGFQRHPGNMAVHFKGSNAARLHGDAWRMGQGTTYILEESPEDYSNNAKEATLMASASHPNSIALTANGGPTVASNLVRFLHLCAPNRVFCISGMHAASGQSGAAASFTLSEEKLVEAVQHLMDLAPQFFGSRVNASPAAVARVLGDRPLTLLDVNAGGCVCRQFWLLAGGHNDVASPGLQTSEAVAEYTTQCVQAIAGVLGSERAAAAAA
jgi:hypothetical protein